MLSMNSGLFVTKSIADLGMTNFELQQIHNCRGWLVPEFHIGEDERLFVDAGRGHEPLLGYVCEAKSWSGVKRPGPNLVSLSN